MVPQQEEEEESIAFTVLALIILSAAYSMSVYTAYTSQRRERLQRRYANLNDLFDEDEIICVEQLDKMD